MSWSRLICIYISICLLADSLLQLAGSISFIDDGPMYSILFLRRFSAHSHIWGFSLELRERRKKHVVESRRCLI